MRACRIIYTRTRTHVRCEYKSRVLNQCPHAGAGAEVAGRNGADECARDARAGVQDTASFDDGELCPVMCDAVVILHTVPTFDDCQPFLQCLEGKHWAGVSAGRRGNLRAPRRHGGAAADCTASGAGIAPVYGWAASGTISFLISISQI